MKFLNFPTLVQDRILKQTSRTEQFILSLCSLKSKEVVKKLCGKNHEVWYEIAEKENKTIFWLQTGKSSELLFYTKWNRPSEEIDVHPTTLKFGDYSMECRLLHRATNHLKILFVSDYQWSYTKQIHNHLCELFNAPTEIYTKLPASSINENLETFVQGRIKKSAIKGSSGINKDEIMKFYRRNPSQELSILDCRIRDLHRTDSDEEIFQTQNLVVRCEKFVDPIFAHFRGNHLLCDNAALEGYIIYLYMVIWLNKSHSRIYKKIKTIIIFANDNSPFDTEKILERLRKLTDYGFQRKPLENISLEEMIERLKSSKNDKVEPITLEKWDPSKRERYYPYSSQIQNHYTFEPNTFDCQDGLDIVRKNDGKRATIKLSPAHFMLFVWD